MSPIYTLLISMIILFIGVNLAANNTLHSYIIGYIFYDDVLSHRILRFLGVMMLISVILLIVDLTIYTVLINLLSLLVFVFLAIRGRSKTQAIINYKKMQAQEAYNEEIKRKKLEIAEIKHRKKSELEEDKGKAKSVTDIKKQLWDDGSMTKKDLINNLKK